MFVPMPLLIVVLVLGLALVLLARRKSSAGGRDPLEDAAAALKRRGVAMTATPQEIEAQARALLAEGNKIEAIKLVREATGMGLKEAKDFVEGL